MRWGRSRVGCATPLPPSAAHAAAHPAVAKVCQLMEAHAVIEGEFQGRGRRLKTYCILPDGLPPRAILCLSHGYADYALSFGKYFLHCPKHHGIGVFMIDHEGHGFSEGLRAYIESYDGLVQDFSQYVNSVATAYPNVPLFVIGKSMGGAIALSSSLQGAPLHNIVTGAVLIAPMCKIADHLKPPKWQVRMLKLLSWMFSKWRVVPVDDTEPLCYRDPVKYEESRVDTMKYRGKLHLRSGFQLYEATLRIAKQISSVTLPFLVVHGKGDRVTEPMFSQELHERAASTDKTILLYEDMYHAILDEPDGGGERVMSDILTWLLARIA
eukprot:m.194243 g.194243  ORF g.194243 m.194243 type:complete len:325 (-) comp53699_c0_seq3:68-1042(-)